MTLNRLLSLCLLATLLPAAFADDAEAKKAILEQMTLARPDIPILDVQPSGLPGFYAVSLPGGQILHFTADGTRFFTGDLYALRPGELVNLSEEGRVKERKQLLDGMKEEEMLVFAPPVDRIKATVTVFTDIDCVYCRKLHKEVPELNRLGIAVRYVAYPRSGIDTPSYEKLVSAWCARDPKVAFTKAKLGQEIEAATCDNPIAAQYEMGGRMGVNSTPALIYEDGTLVPGYLPAQELATKLGIM